MDWFEECGTGWEGSDEHEQPLPSPYYILREDGEMERVPQEKIEEWARWREFTDRTIALDLVGSVSVSTVFTGIDRNIGFGGTPLLFETMVFGLTEEEEEAFGGEVEILYATRAEAEMGHAATVAHVEQTLRRLHNS